MGGGFLFCRVAACRQTDYQEKDKVFHISNIDKQVDFYPNKCASSPIREKRYNNFELIFILGVNYPKASLKTLSVQNKETVSDEQLYKLSSTGNEAAFTHLYSKYHRVLTSFANTFMFNQEQSEDIVQEVFIKIIQQPEHFDVNRKLSSWLFTVTANACRNRLRDEQNRARIREEVFTKSDETVKPETSHIDRRIVRDKIYSILAKYSERDRQLYTLRYEQDLTFREIAEILELPEGTVKSGVFYLLKKMKNELKEYQS